MEKLTLLNPKTTSMDGIGGIPELTPSDLAACCAGANEAGFLLLTYQVCGVGEYKRLHATFLPEAIRLARRLKWSLKRPERLDMFLKVMLVEAIADKRCPSCRGTKYSLMSPSSECRTCRGTGIYMLQDYAKAEIMEISKQAYSKTWYPREKDIKALFDRRIYQAKQSIFKRLREEAV
jgi:hypothetical protein